MVYSIDNRYSFDFASLFQSSQHALSVTFKNLTSQISKGPASGERPASRKSEPKALKTIFPPIETETRTHVSTACAAFWLNRAEQTLRLWASEQKGDVRPIHVNGRLAWPVAEIKKVLGLI